VVPRWEALGELAARSGHGGGDFWTLYYFARQILDGTRAPFDIYRAADVTIPGIQAYRSSVEGGKPCAVSDFRDPGERERHREDRFAQPRFDHVRGLFPGKQDESLTGQFALTMRDLIRTATAYRAYRDWNQVRDDMADPGRFLDVVDRLLEALPRLAEATRLARRLIAAHPGSPGARVLGEMLALLDEQATSPGFAKDLEREQRALAGSAPGKPA
jgi:hypothetical protein